MCYLASWVRSILVKASGYDRKIKKQKAQGTAGLMALLPCVTDAGAQLGRDLFSLVDELENRLQSLEDPLAIVGDGFAGGLRDKAGFANQVG